MFGERPSLTQRAYWFHNGSLRDGRPVPPVGEWLEHEGPVEICRTGLHASKHPFDALRYAPGPYLCLVDVDGVEGRGGDKLVARRRKILKQIDATDMLRKFARLCALDVVHLWDAPDVVVMYLKTGDEAIRDAARSAARSAAWSAAWDATWVAEQAAADSAVRAAVRTATEASLRIAAQDAAWVAARAASQAKHRRRFARMAREVLR